MASFLGTYLKKGHQEFCVPGNVIFTKKALALHIGAEADIRITRTVFANFYTIRVKNKLKDKLLD